MARRREPGLMDVSQAVTAADVATWRAELAAALRLYETSLAAHGPEVGALRWGSTASQERRFRVLSEMPGLMQASVVDLGCGLGDLYPFLREHGFAGNYAGIDPLTQFVEVARARYPGARFELGSAFDMPRVDEADFMVASGIFAFVSHRPLACLQHAVDQMLRSVRVGVAFNVLSQWGDAPESEECQYDPAQVLAMLHALADRVVLRHDYMPHDFTAYVWKR
jgi:SAM-dependent methyltransferase